MSRLTPGEEDAILTAIGQVLAGPVIDGYDEDDPEEAAIRRRLLSAKVKLHERAERRERRR